MEKDKALGLLTGLLALRNERVEEYRQLSQWIEEFERDGYTLADIEKMISIAKEKPKYGLLSYGDLVTGFKERGGEATGLTAYRAWAKAKFKEMNETAEGYFKRILELTAEAENRVYEADLKRFREDAEFRRKEIADEVNGVLERLESKFNAAGYVVSARMVRGERR